MARRLRMRGNHLRWRQRGAQLHRLGVFSVTVASSALAGLPAGAAGAAAAGRGSRTCNAAAGAICALAEGVDYTVVAREPGAERTDLPIFTTRPGLISFEHEGWAGAAALAAGAVDLELDRGLPGGLLLPGVLTAGECAQLMAAADAMGFTEDAPVSLGRHIRHNENHVWMADDSLWLPIYTRLEGVLPPTAGASGAKRLIGLNQRWRLYKYGPGDVFKPHTDGDWPGSAMVDGALRQDAFGDRRSAYTIVLCATRPGLPGHCSADAGRPRSAL